MIKGILQTDKRLLKVINDYGCLFLCFAHCSKTVFKGTKGCEMLNSLWLDAVKAGYITSDLNDDSDYDVKISCPFLRMYNMTHYVTLPVPSALQPPQGYPSPTPSPGA